MAGISLSGLASGVDTNLIVEQLMAIERRPQLKMELQKRQADTRQNALEDIASRLRNLKDKATALRTLTSGGAQTVESGDSTKVAARLVSGAGPGGYQLSVERLASAQQRTYAFSAPAADTYFKVTTSAGAYQIDLTAGDDLKTTVEKINADANAPVYAADVGGKLVLSSRTTGQVGDFSIAPGDDPSGLLTFESEKYDAANLYKLDAAYTLDGVGKTSSSNVITDGIAGVEVTLKAVTSSAVSINVSTPATSRDQIKQKVKDFVEQYNSTIDLIRTKVSERKVPNPQNDADAMKGLLAGDPMLNGVLSRLRSAIAEEITGNPDSLNQLTDIGVSTGAAAGSTTFSKDAVAGKLVLDETKLDAALNSDLEGVKQFLGAITGTAGFAQRMEDLIDPLTQTDGDLDVRIDSADAEMKRLTDRIAYMETRLTAKQARLKAQFTAMEQALGQSQSQGSWLGAQLAALNR